ncbi:MAG TPA: NACHT domain-containing protein, partial [Aggregatilineales bacterium]|nr:NACHT domain-containing protein [Aggregatilineales bacterium]
SSDIRELIYSLWEQIAGRYGLSDPIPQGYEELIETFPRFLVHATEEHPLVIFLDALDQLSTTNTPTNLRWLPKYLPPHVKIVLSVIPSPYLNKLKSRLPETNSIEIMPMISADADKLLDLWL